MGRWVAVPNMHLRPYRCVGCGQTPTKGTEKESEGQEEAYFCEGVDINWGDSLFICSSCARVIGQLHGMLEPEDSEKLKDERDDLDAALTELRAEHKALTERVDRMLDGVRAKKEVQKTRKPKKKVPANA